MGYQLEWCSWEITRKCNMNCDICLCGNTKQAGGELSTDEALKLCQEMKDMNVKRVVLTGGEPLLRPDWSILAEKLSKDGIEPQLVTNGTLIDKKTVEDMKKSGIKKVTISIDGTEAVHDKIRAKGSFMKCEKAVRCLQDADIPLFIATTVTGDNFKNIPLLREKLKNLQVENWILHLGLPYGSFIENDIPVLKGEEVRELLNQCYRFAVSDQDMKIYLGDSIGYYTEKEVLTRSIALQTEKIPVFTGCPAGISTLAIASNGDILTISLSVEQFIAGNIRMRTLKDIWEDDDNPAWKWRRKFKEEELKGACKSCEYVSVCKGGCPAVRYALTGDIMGENPLCMYRDAKRSNFL